jgi:hypothetical protein
MQHSGRGHRHGPLPLTIAATVNLLNALLLAAPFVAQLPWQAFDAS